MSDIIKLLPDAVANQIAAGEVIQRPSSVIKELVENAIDAGASRIQIFITDAGKTCIQVVDDGKGMSETDARLAFERHATSKISEATDLFSLRTMGFRGEALASIAAVAQVELRTRLAENTLGVCINIEGSKVAGQEPIACPIGSSFAVRNLFYNIPARRKFLKSNQTEMSNIMQEFERIALAHPDIAFTLHTEEKPLLSLSPGNFRQRITGIFGKKIDSQLVPVEVETSLATISGYVGVPNSARKKGLHQFFFANGRYMRHPYFAKAVMSAYERLIPEGEQIHYFLNFKLDPSRIDVNIHPQKTEIKFQDDQALWQIILAAVREALGKFNAVPTIDFDTANSPSIPIFNPESDSIIQPKVHIDNQFNPFDNNRHTTSISHTSPSHSSSNHRNNNDWEKLYSEALNKDSSTSNETVSPENPTLYSQLTEEEQMIWEKNDAPCFQFRGRFIITATNKGLLLIDQHRAHMRVLYDMYRQQQSEHQGVSQGLLFPQMLQLSLSAASTFETLLPALADVGFDLSPLGGGSYAIQGIPTGTEGVDYVALLQGIADDALQGKLQAGEPVMHLIALSLAQRAALPVGQYLTHDEMTDLIERLLASTDATYAPNGHKIQVLMSIDSLLGYFN